MAGCRWLLASNCSRGRESTRWRFILVQRLTAARGPRNALPGDACAERITKWLLIILFKRRGRHAGALCAAVDTAGVAQVSIAGSAHMAHYYRLISKHFVLYHVINPVHHRTLFIIAPAEGHRGRACVREMPPDQLCMLHSYRMTEELMPAPSPA